VGFRRQTPNNYSHRKHDDPRKQMISGESPSHVQLHAVPEASDGKLLLESKQDMRKRGVPSPDEADAVALCFADASGFPRGKNFNRDLTERYSGLYV
jgi:hypothetical protein